MQTIDKQKSTCYPKIALTFVCLFSVKETLITLQEEHLVLTEPKIDYLMFVRFFSVQSEFFVQSMTKIFLVDSHYKTIEN